MLSTSSNGSTGRLRKGARFEQLRVSWMLVTVLGLVALAALVLAPNIALLIEQRAEIADLEQQVAEQQQSVDDLTTEVSQWQDPAFVEAQARERLAYVYPGDRPFSVIDDRPESEQGEPEFDYSAELEADDTDWVQAGLESVIVGGLAGGPEQSEGSNP